MSTTTRLAPLLLAVSALSAGCAGAAQDEPRAAVVAAALPSWNDGPARESIIDFVARVTDPRAADFVPVAERLAVFDNDGTLWSEQPTYFQFLFAVDRMIEMAEADPELAVQEPYRWLLADGLAALPELDVHELLGPLTSAHAGVTEAEFRIVAAEWIAAARHPTRDVPFTDLTYAPMVELLEYLRANGFETWICTGGGRTFVRLISESAYGIPPEQVIGSRLKLRFEVGPGGPELHRLPELAHINDGGGKPVGIANSVGRRPILAFGNSDGDIEMLQFAADGNGPALALLLHHDDAEREWAYDRDSTVGRLDRGFGLAADNGWVIVSMRDAWSRVFADGE